MLKYSKKAFLLIMPLWIIGACTINAPLDYHVSNNQFYAEEEFSHTVMCENRDKLYLESVNGTVDVLGIPGLTEIVIQGERRVESESVRDAEEHLYDLYVDVYTYDHSIVVKTTQPSTSGGRNYIVNYRILVPEHWDVIINQVNGPVIADSLSGLIDISVVNGNVNMKDARGELFIDITNGSAFAELTLPINGDCHVRTVNGHISLSIPEFTSAGLSANVINGTVGTENLLIKNLSQSAHNISGTLGEGEGSIILSVVNGTIFIRGF